MQKKLSSRALAICLSVIMVFSLIQSSTMSVFATDEVESGAVTTQEQQMDESNATNEDEETSSPVDSNEDEETNSSSSSNDVSSPSSSTSTSLSNYIRYLSVEGNPDSVSDGDKVTVRFGWLIEGEIHGGSDTFTYQLPVNFDISDSSTGYITKGTGSSRTKIGTYTVDSSGLVTVKYNDDYNTSSQSTVNYMSITGVAKYGSDSDKHQIVFTWKDGTETKVIEVTNPGDFTVAKTSNKTYPDTDGQMSNSSVIEYTVDISSKLGTKGDFEITDTLTTAGFGASDKIAYDKNSFVLKDADGKSIDISPVFDGDTFTIKNVPALGEGEQYTLTYNVNVNMEAGTNLKSEASVTNKVSVSNDSFTHTDTTTTKYQRIISKTATKFDNALGRMNWTVTIATNGTNLNGYTFEDVADAEIINTSGSTPVLQALNADGSYKTSYKDWVKVDGNKISITFGDTNGAATLKLTYYTKIDGEVGETVKTTNTATIFGENDEEWSVTVSQEGVVKGNPVVKKTGAGYEDNGDGTVTFKWNASVDYSNVEEKNKYEIYDTIGDARVWQRKVGSSGGDWMDWNKTYASDHYAIAAELDASLRDSLRVTVLNSEGEEEVLTYSQVNALGANAYFVYYNRSNGVKINSTDSALHMKLFFVYIKDLDKIGYTLKNVSFSYYTIYDTSHYASNTTWKMINALTADKVTSTEEQLYKESVDEDNSISKQLMINTEIWSDADQTLTYDGTSKTLTYRLLAYVPEGETTVNISDQIPEGMEVVEDSIKVGSYYADKNKSEYTWTNKSNVKITYPSDDNGNKIEVQLASIGTDLKLASDNNIVVVEYQLQTPEDLTEVEGVTIKHSDNSYTATKKFTNVATYGDKTATLNVRLTGEISVLNKTGEQVKENGANTDKVHYSVKINSSAADLVPDSDELTLTDTVTSEALDFKLDATSIKLYAMNEDGSKGKEVDPLSINVSQPTTESDTTEQSFTISVKDEAAYILEYDYTVDKREASTAATEGKLTNTIKLEGYASTKTNTEVKGINVRATSLHAGLQLTKVDSNNNTKFLSAKFELAEYSDGEYKKVEDFTIGGEDGYTFDYFSEKNKLSGNTLYRITEIEAPDGYTLDETPFYFIVKGNISDVTDPDDITETSDEDAKEIAKAPEGIDINMLSPTGSSYYEITNDKIETTAVSVTKAWNDNDNQDGIRPDSVTVKLLADGEDTGKTVTLSSDNNWTASFDDLYKTTSKGEEISYTVKEVAVDGYKSEITGSQSEGYTITNTHEAETIDVSGSKTWVDHDNKYGKRPESIKINLLADGVVIDSKTVSEDDDWSWDFEDLTKYKGQGTEIVYSITEEAVEGYSTSYEGYDVTNTYAFTRLEVIYTSVTVSKAWSDEDDKDGIRPDSVTIKLLADGEDTGKTIELNDDNNWTGSFTELEQAKDGEEIAYTVEEVSVEGYSAEVSGNQVDGYIITNSHTPDETVDTPEDTDNPTEDTTKSTKDKSNKTKTTSNSPSTGDDSNILLYLLSLITSMLLLAGLMIYRRNTNKA